ncbi:3-isopropylmalate dehydrogenase [Arsenicicoccus dermatophilus]
MTDHPGAMSDDQNAIRRALQESMDLREQGRTDEGD